MRLDKVEEAQTLQYCVGYEVPERADEVNIRLSLEMHFPDDNDTT